MKMIVIAATLLLMANAMSFEDEQELENQYCEMVKSGAWQHYNKSIDCK